MPDDRIFFVQLADAPLIDMDLLYWSRHFRNMPGEGDLDVTGSMRAVTGTPEASDASLVRIDHIAQTMDCKDMLTWTLFYTSIFATRRAPMVDIADSAGLVRSQAVETADGAMHITPNGAESQHTLAGHFIAESFGSAVQHIAFQTRDIFASAAALATSGFKLLVLSKNYYADLAARFDLDRAFIDRLAANNILYDRDEHGEFFRLYSSNFGEGFFFEIVERRGGYNGYGAANAQFRIAAQKRALRAKEMPRYRRPA